MTPRYHSVADGGRNEEGAGAPPPRGTEKRLRSYTPKPARSTFLW